jgi:5'-nucleotidase
MHKPITDLSSARILISNDDGVTAPGIKVLERIALTLSKDVWVVAPEHEQSAAAHSLTIRRPLRVRKVSRRRFAVDGTPTDAVLLGIRHVLRDKAPDLVLSGINRGANLGDDVTYSGTVAAAIEGTLLGVRSIAFSQEGKAGETIHWATAEHFAADLIRRLVSTGWGRNVLLNVNFPDCAASQVTGVEVVRQGKRKIGDELMERLDPRGEPYVWIGAQRQEDRAEPGTDLEAVFRGAISVTPLGIDLTHRDTIDSLRAVLG